jgi:DNA-binding transcriptional MerR regulator
MSQAESIHAMELEWMHSRFVDAAPPVTLSTSTGTLMTTTYRIGDLAREFDLTPRAMRFYEDMGLLRPERCGARGQQRVYSSRDRVRLKLTLRAKRLGLSLTEAKALIDMYDSPRDTGPQLERFLQVLGEHRAQLEARMAELQATLGEIEAHEREARSLLRQLQAPPAAGGKTGGTRKRPAVAETASAGTKRANRTPRTPRQAPAGG